MFRLNFGASHILRHTDDVLWNPSIVFPNMTDNAFLYLALTSGSIAGSGLDETNHALWGTYSK
jgi:hypothetical protein